MVRTEISGQAIQSMSNKRGKDGNKLALEEQPTVSNQIQNNR